MSNASTGVAEIEPEALMLDRTTFARARRNACSAALHPARTTRADFKLALDGATVDRKPRRRVPLTELRHASEAPHRSGILPSHISVPGSEDRQVSPATARRREGPALST